jgi:uncharacterized lipoprotein YmbA
MSLGAAVLMAACSSTPPPRFHSLLSAAQSLGVPPLKPLLAWQLLPITVPAQVDQPQFVVRRSDDSLVVLEQERWIAPLQDELRAALVEQLSITLGLPGANPPPQRKGWRVAVDVSRFDSTPGRALLVVQWSVTASNLAEPVLRCRGQFEQPVAGGMAALAQGHRQAIARLAGVIAPALLSLDADKATVCS